MAPAATIASSFAHFVLAAQVLVAPASAESAPQNPAPALTACPLNSQPETVFKNIQQNFINIAGMLERLKLLEPEMHGDILQEIPVEDENAYRVKRDVEAYSVELEKHMHGEYSGYIEYHEYPHGVLAVFADRVIGYLDALNFIYQDDASVAAGLRSIDSDKSALNDFVQQNQTHLAANCNQSPPVLSQPVIAPETAKAEPPPILAF